MFLWDKLPSIATGFDMGCGSGRWARLFAPRVGHLYCIEPSVTLEVAKQAMSEMANVTLSEQRFPREGVPAMLSAAGPGQVRFSDRPPCWCAVGIKQ